MDSSIAFYISFYVSILVSLFVAFSLLCFSIVMSQKQVQEKADARRLTEYKMNARLLRMNL